VADSSQQTATLVSAPAIPVINLRWYFGLFVVSGFCGLVYEVVWVRLAMAGFGVTTALVSIVLSTFMAGLGVGSWAAGILARRILSGNGSRALRIYALVEFLIGVSSLAVPFEFRVGRLLLLHAGGFAAWQSLGYYVLAGIWIAVTLLPWCTCMGATFPLLMAAIRQTARPASERSFSYLYLANVVGAFLGTIISAFILIELLGFHGTLYVAGVLNATVAFPGLQNQLPRGPVLLNSGTGIGAGASVEALRVAKNGTFVSALHNRTRQHGDGSSVDSRTHSLPRKCRLYLRGDSRRLSDCHSERIGRLSLMGAHPPSRPKLLYMDVACVECGDSGDCGRSTAASDWRIRRFAAANDRTFLRNHGISYSAAGRFLVGPAILIGRELPTR
jgi:hypothetical protein